MVRITMNGKLFFAPIGDKPGRILDIGTGTGIWAIDVGDEYPDAEIIGTDISPTQPSWYVFPFSTAKEASPAVSLRERSQGAGQREIRDRRLRTAVDV